MVIVNNDGTPFEPPENPLLDKWKRLYPPMRNGKPCGPVVGEFEDGRPIMNYTCVVCGEDKCMYSDSWKCPEEDEEIYDAWIRDKMNYIKLHNKDVEQTLENYLKMKEKITEQL